MLYARHYTMFKLGHCMLQIAARRDSFLPCFVEIRSTDDDVVVRV